MCTKSAAVVSLVPVSPTRTRRAEGEEVHPPATDLSLEVRPEIRGVRLQTIWMESQAETTPGRGRARAGWRGRAGLADISPHAAPTALQMARTLAWYWRLQRATRGKRSHPQLIFCVCVCVQGEISMILVRLQWMKWVAAPRPGLKSLRVKAGNE